MLKQLFLKFWGKLILVTWLVDNLDIVLFYGFCLDTGNFFHSYSELLQYLLDAMLLLKLNFDLNLSIFERDQCC